MTGRTEGATVTELAHALDWLPRTTRAALQTLRSDTLTETISSPLSGMLFDHEGRPLTPSHASKRGVRYRYYVADVLMTGLAAEHPDAWRLQAKPVEDAARSVLARLLRSSRLAQVILEAGVSAFDQKHSPRAARRSGGRSGPVMARPTASF